jgi:hypothetical protein
MIRALSGSKASGITKVSGEIINSRSKVHLFFMAEFSL